MKIINTIATIGGVVGSALFAECLTKGDSKLEFINIQANNLKSGTTQMLNQANVILNNLQRLEQEEKKKLTKITSYYLQDKQKVPSLISKTIDKKKL